MALKMKRLTLGEYEAPPLVDFPTNDTTGPMLATRCPDHIGQRWLGDRYETCGECTNELHHAYMKLRKEYNELLKKSPEVEPRCIQHSKLPSQ